jgi:LysM repeat protein
VSVKGFSANAEMNQPGERELIASRIAYQQTLLLELLDFSVIQRRLHYIQKQIKENSNVLLPAFAEIFNTMSEKLASELIGIVYKFNPQIGQLLIEQPMIESNEALQERIKKACTYFAEKTEEHICRVLQNTDIETDNKEIRKSLKEGMENLYMEAFIKTASFKACTSGFSVKTYLDAKAKASIEKIQLKKEVKVPVYNPESGSANISLLQDIKAWRNAKADEEDLPLYMVLPQKTLYELVEKMPVTLRQLKDINGFGKKKVLKYGDELIAMICSHLDVELPEESAADLPMNERVRKPKPEKGQTQKLSLEMFKQGKTIEEIAKERSLTSSTIGGHLARFVASGEIDILKIISPEKLQVAVDYFKTAGTASISEAMATQGNQFTYWEMRMVQAYLFTNPPE